ncbi:unnamed protein product [Kuraishia capsulata CBS 1993]|uniref:Phospholipid-transporting ATPase n=1 Tax=Kuraishia capsulata CBS 1993 TaxID=1382522 RepID=W6MVE1_9ASCO|nr:uncharacterized protein KUCA_T00005906001 [Kuraishia capsulata CBS 1993]CDK29912.1 unnamed protein product [Kuraishia capsulata CBS 1993]
MANNHPRDDPFADSDEDILFDLGPSDTRHSRTGYQQNVAGGYSPYDGRVVINSAYDAADPFFGTNEHLPNLSGHPVEDPFYDPDDNSIVPDITDTQNGSSYPAENKPQGLRNIYNNMKSKLTMGDYRPPTASADEELYQDSRPPPDRDLSEDFKNMFDIRRIVKKILRKPQDDASQGPRIIHLNDAASNNAFGYMDNHISTTKYNAATFVPKFLFEQFSKYANLFFLFTSIIQQVPNVSPTNRYTTIGTLAIVLLVSALKEITEDFKRMSADNELNRAKVEVLEAETGNFVHKKWIKVFVGDIVRVRNGDPFPADLILLNSSEPEGICYVETANLDGETNLKIKQSKTDTVSLVDSRDLARLNGKIKCEPPNSSLYTFEGTLFFNNQEVALSPDQLLPRGASLRNTGWVHGIVIFTGHETKLMRNATAAPIKRTDVERVINLQIIALFGILITLSVVSSFGDLITMISNAKNMKYLYLEGTNKLSKFFLDLLTYWILFSNLVPISLFVTVEIIKYYQAWMIASDVDMYYEPTDTPTVCRTSSLVEELGQIEYVFSDKTGTLTRNIMEYKTCSIAGKCYIEEIPEDSRAEIVDGVETGYHSFADLKAELATGSSDAKIINEFFTLLATCHTVIPEVLETGETRYQAASPDEGALVDGAASLGYKFTIRKPTGVFIEVDGEEQWYELLNICEFNSTRKRMSGLFRCPDGTIKLYTKGADTVILERLQDENPFVDVTLKHMEEFAAEGLRTLCIATRIIPEKEYQEWNKIFQKASTTLVDRSQALDDAAELIEKDLFLLGATAIEDKLQDGVPETIHTLQTAGIRVWVLTGDRQETAINIGMSCRLLSEDMNLLIVNEDNKEDTRQNLTEKCEALRENDLSQEDMESLALVIDGKSLGFALESDLEDMFLEIGLLCKAVICCRVSPLQKALVVKLVKRKKKALLLAIGDGANDVSMIQAAHVGVGISGMEGMQAARSADFAIGQFRFLEKLLLVHGSWSYRRISLAILYSFYKNIALYMTQFWYVFSNGFSGQSIMESWTLTFYNVIFTVLPPFVIGVFDQYVSAQMLTRYPQMYKAGQRREFFNVETFWSWAINGFYHSAILYLGAINIYKYGNQLHDGHIVDHWSFGVALYSACMFTALGKAALVSSVWTKFTLIAIPGSILLWLCLYPPYAYIAPKVNVSKELLGTVPVVYNSMNFWFMIFILPVLCLSRDFLWKYYRRMYRPETYHVVQELQKAKYQETGPRSESFRNSLKRLRQSVRMRKRTGFAFDQGGTDQDRLMKLFDTTKKRDDGFVRAQVNESFL